MYVKPQPLTFADLSKAMQRDAGFSGLGQTTCDPFGCYDSSQYVDYGSASSLPLSSTPSAELNPSSPSYNPYSVALTAAGASAPTAMPWGTLGLVAGGLILFGLLVGNK